MDEEERKKYPSLPPDYVSLVQLKERWLQKQEEERNGNEKRKKQEEIQRSEEVQKPKNENDHRIAKDYWDRKNEKKVEAPSAGYGRRQRLEKDEQKMRVKIGGSQGDGKMGGIDKEKKRKKKYRQKKKNRAVGENGGGDTERVVIENEEEKKIPGNGNSCNDEWIHGKIEKNVLDCAEILSRNEVVGILEGSSRKSSVKDGFSGELQETEGTFSASTVEVLAENGGREKMGVFRGKIWKRKEYRGGFKRNDKNGKTEYKMKEKSVEKNELKGSGELSLEKKERERTEFQRGAPGEQNGNEKGFRDGFQRNDKNERTKGKSIGIDELKGSEELASEKKEGERNEFPRNGKNRGRDYKVKGYGVKGEDLNGTGVTPEKVADDVSVGESVRNDAKCGVRNGFRRQENRMGKIGRKFGNLSLNDGKVGNLAPKVEIYGGGRRRYGNSGRFGNFNMNKVHIGLAWVKRQEISDVNAAEIAFSGM
ncbi:Hypothetical predicted protein [Olea europaea subsp. europaea]|uniref:Uncharacterized protein n=1 Tax=Olea europaea subsp. europaea TaxID=158383 RepID=A0A8S0QK84_OLEEU|nr:Hypothetical predicted protein [Olea europaea subsp. europaea]